jgi:hypothetical protein
VTHAGPTNDKVYIHEFIDIIGHQRAKYMHHMTANWCPEARKERRQLCFGVWGTVGSTGRWPEVVNLWEIDGWDGLAHDFAHELGRPTLQDPMLAEWWAKAAEFRRGGFDRILVPAPFSPTIDALNAAGTRGDVYAHELVKLLPGDVHEYLHAVEHDQQRELELHQLTLVGAFRTAMVSDDEAIVIWAMPSFAVWAELEHALDHHPGLRAWRTYQDELGARVHRTLLVDAPLSPLRLGRQPEVGDRRPFEEIA